MPKATVSSDVVRKDLKSLAEGFVSLKRMSYGQSVQRRAMLRMSFETTGKKNDFRGEMAMASEEIQRYEFAHCIVDHNLEDDNGVKLNLGSAQGMAQLDPQVGQEIEKYIEEMNNFEDEVEAEGN